jgi:S1-C subfamily serine protease
MNAYYQPPGSGSEPSSWIPIDEPTTQRPGGWAPPPPPPNTTKPAAKHSTPKTVGLVAAAAAVALATGLGVGHFALESSSKSASGPNFTRGLPSQTGNGDSGSSNSNSTAAPDVNALVNSVSPGLVDINTTLSYQDAKAAGTGMVLTSSGEVLTNNHVIDGATAISVTDLGNGKTYNATVVGYDTSDDVAVLQLQNASGLQTVALGDSSKVSVGDAVVGIGNAGGTGGTPSAAAGNVTALDQSITASDDLGGTSEQLSGLIEVNADIESGDSGGPLVNNAGQVIGIDTAGSTSSSNGAGGGSSQGGSSTGGSSTGGSSTGGSSTGGSSSDSATVGFAIPINHALSIAKEIVAGTGSSTVHIGTTGFLGVEISTSSSSSGFGRFGGGSSNSTSGATIAQVIDGSAAQQAGLSAGDVITSINGSTVDSSSDLSTQLFPFHGGDTIQVGWTDGSGQQHTTSVQLSSGPAQ